MIIISQDQALQRWDDLPSVLKDEMVSEANSDFLWKICEAEHIPDEKIYDAARMVSYALLGFIHPGDLGEEFTEVLAVNRQIADSIAKAVNDRILSPLKDELDEIYEPPSKLGRLASELPRLVEEIKIVPAPPSPSQVSFGNLGGQAAPSAPSSGSLGEFARLGINSSTPLATGEKSAIPGPRESASALSGVEGSSPRQSASMEPPPTMIHEETPIRPAQQTSSFKIETPITKLSDIKAGSGPDVPRPAFVDFGPPRSEKSAAKGEPRQWREFHPNDPNIPPKPKVESPPPPKLEATLPPQAKPFDATRGKPFDGTQAKPPRIVHYTEFRTPLDNTRDKQPEKPAQIPGNQVPVNLPPADVHVATEKLPEKETVPPIPPPPPRPRIEPPEIKPPGS